MKRTRVPATSTSWRRHVLSLIFDNSSRTAFGFQLLSLSFDLRHAASQVLAA